MTSVLINGKFGHGHRLGETTYEDEGRDWGNAYMSQIPSIVSKHQGRGMEQIISQSPLKEFTLLTP